eukprot:g2240.t1
MSISAIAANNPHILHGHKLQRPSGRWGGVSGVAGSSEHDNPLALSSFLRGNLVHESFKTDPCSIGHMIRALDQSMQPIHPSIRTSPTAKAAIKLILLKILWELTRKIRDLRRQPLRVDHHDASTALNEYCESLCMPELLTHAEQEARQRRVISSHPRTTSERIELSSSSKPKHTDAWEDVVDQVHIFLTDFFDNETKAHTKKANKSVEGKRRKKRKAKKSNSRTGDSNATIQETSVGDQHLYGQTSSTSETKPTLNKEISGVDSDGKPKKEKKFDNPKFSVDESTSRFVVGVMSYFAAEIQSLAGEHAMEVSGVELINMEILSEAIDEDEELRNLDVVECLKDNLLNGSMMSELEDMSDDEDGHGRKSQGNRSKSGGEYSTESSDSEEDIVDLQSNNSDISNEGIPFGAVSEHQYGEALENMMDMGFPEHWCLNALNMNNGDETASVAWIINNSDQLAQQDEADRSNSSVASASAEDELDEHSDNGFDNNSFGSSPDLMIAT